MHSKLCTKRSIGALGVLLLCVLQPSLAGCGTQESTSDVQNGASIGNDSDPNRDGDERKTEVVVIATQHFLTDMPEGYTPGHLRALLEKVAPDVLAVEAPTNVPNPLSLAPFELWNVTQPWAAQSGTKIEPTGWHEPQYSMQLNKMYQQYQAKGRAGKYRQVEQTFQSKISAQPLTCKFMNSAASHKIWRDYHHKLHELSEADTPWEKWNAKILANIQKLCRKHPGKRVAVIFGGAHGYYFLDHLANDPKITLVSAEKFFPLTEEEVSANTQQIDYLKAMRPVNFTVVSKAQLKHARTLLAKVKDVPEFSGDYLIFNGKCLMHEGKAKEALAEFQKLSKYPRDTLSKSDGKSRLAEIALVYSALAQNQMGNRAEARKQLGGIANDNGVSPATRQLAQQFLAGIPRK